MDPGTYQNSYMNNLNYSIHNQIDEVKADGLNTVRVELSGGNALKTDDVDHGP
jgi:hypothetical protein